MSNGVDDTGKPFYTSRRFWGAVFGFAGTILPMLGIGATDDIIAGGSAWMNWIEATMAVVGWGVAFWGGVQARQPLAFRPSKFAP